MERLLERTDAFVRLALGIGVEGREMAAAQMALRAAVVYVVALAIIRMAKKRFMGQATPFDMILVIMLGSIASRAVTGGAPLFTGLAAMAVLVGLHWCFSAVAMRSRRVSAAVKGCAQVLVRDGRIDRTAMRSAHLSDGDLAEVLRHHGVGDLNRVAEARLERDGGISLVQAGAEPRILDIAVEEGVKTVRVELR